MGAWGAGSFENDAAMDFVAEINSLDDLSAALQRDDPEAEIDADAASRIIVVAECAAALRGHPCEDFPEELAEKLSGIGQSKMLTDDSRDLLSVVIAGSELTELWAEAGASEWNKAMTDLIERLGRKPVGAKAKSAKRKAKKKPQINRSPCAFCGEEMGEGAFTQFDITLEEDDISSMRQGGWAHLKCLNAALHPRHMIQHWKFDEEDIQAAVDKLLGRDSAED